MLRRITEDRDVDAVLVHKIGRLARNIEDHVAIRAVLRRCGVTLVSVSEKLEETAAGRLVEGIHALIAEFYSANLAAEVRKARGRRPRWVASRTMRRWATSTCAKPSLDSRSRTSFPIPSERR